MRSASVVSPLMITAILGLILTSNASANYAPELPTIPSRRVQLNQALTPINNHHNNKNQHRMGGRTVIAESAVHVPNAAWMRVEFTTDLLAMLHGDMAVVLVSERDQAVQTLSSSQLREWNLMSAYFNGDSVSLYVTARHPSELLDSRVAIKAVEVGEYVSGRVDASSICTNVDRRQASKFGRSARMMPVGCTAWMIDDAQHCFLSAGHCKPWNDQNVVQFNVPPSLEDGTVQHPHPNDQYMIDSKSIQSDEVEEGNDWLYFGAHRNTNTNLTAFEAQQDCYRLSKNATAPPVPETTLQIIGYGTTKRPFLAKNQIQQVHQGPFLEDRKEGYLWSLAYRVDTTGGNSGSAIENAETGEAIGVHAYAGCRYNPVGRSPMGANTGTFIGNGRIQRALASPRGVCAHN